MSTTADIFYNPDDVDGEPGSPVSVTKTLIAAPNTATTIVGYFDQQALTQRMPGVVIENTAPNLKALTASLAAEKAATYTIGGVVYYEASREQLNVEETLLNLSTISTT